jgi:hypothetical protein
VFFDEQMPEALLAAIERFERASFDADAARENALQFSRERSRIALADALGIS